MKTTFLSYLAATRSLVQPGILWHLLWPALLATMIWIGVLVWHWDTLIIAGMRLIASLPLLGDWLTAPETGLLITLILIKIALVMLMMPVIYVTATFLVAALALPLMLEKVAAKDYADIERRNGGSQLGSIWNALTSVLLFLLALTASLPLWLIPGAGLVVSVLLTAWLNKRAFQYDALMMHADKSELSELRRDLGGSLFVIGLGGALLAHVPFINLFAPALTGLAFVHYLLAALRNNRLLTN